MLYVYSIKGVKRNDKTDFISEVLLMPGAMVHVGDEEYIIEDVSPIDETRISCMELAERY